MKETMRILYLTSSLEWGGAQNITVGLAEQAAMAGYEVSILTVLPGNDYQERLQDAQIAFHSLEYTGSFKPAKLVSLLKLRWRVRNHVQELSPDVIHEQLFIPKLLLFGMSGIAGHPVIHTQQDNSPWWRKRDLKSRCQTFVERVFLKRTACINIAISESVMNDMVEVFGVSPAECHLVYNFLDRHIEPRLNGLRIASSPKTIFMITRLVWEKKGLDTALKVIREVSRRVPDVKLIIVGDGPDRVRMEQAAIHEGVEKYVEFRGYRSDVQSQYAEADVVFMPSRWEGFGITAIEAAAHGVPVVGSRVGGLQEVVNHGETGFTCPPEDVPCFVQYLVRILTDHRLYEQLATNAVHRAREFSAEEAFLSYEELYRKARSK